MTRGGVFATAMVTLACNSSPGSTRPLGPALTSIGVTPAAPTIAIGATQQFAATGTYSDGTTQDLTDQVTWTSSTQAVATISAAGLATGASAGTTTTSGEMSGVVGSTTLAVAPRTYTFWAPSAAPAVMDIGPDSAAELGVKFRADVDGFATGVRFYKSTANTGPHVGNVWTSTGTPLASANFTNETTSGWQQVSFSSPVPIAANTVYVASYHASAGHYSGDAGYFNGKGVDNPPLHALADGVSGADGVYAYGANSTFPSNSFNSLNYWVDVLFSPATAPASLVSIAVTPATSMLQMGTTERFAASGTYSDGTTVDIGRAVTWASGNTTVATVRGSGIARAMSAGATQISATLDGLTGSAAVTVPTPAPQASEGPGGPILVVSSSGNPFSRYCAEILRAEGFDEFIAMDVANVDSSTLAGYDLVVLGDISLTSAQAQMFTSWVTGGGKLIAMHPDKQLADLLGIRDASGALSDGYLLVDTSSPPGTGIVGETMQFHGSADLYTLAGATPLATLYSSASAATAHPAVTLKSAGLGEAAAFTYDLARSVVTTRQGNPAWSGQKRDGLLQSRSDDLFYGPADFDPRPSWVDPSKVAIPQADEQQRLLANLLIQMNLSRRPLPRFWYFPSSFKAVVIMTGDDHAKGGTVGRFDFYVNQSASGCSVADWQCIRGTSYVYPNEPISSALARQYTSKGFELALHVSTNCADWTSRANLDAAYVSQLDSFASSFPGLPAPTTNRTHCVVWTDYDTQPKVELAHGIRLDTTYYYYPPSWVSDRPGLFTGSGIPMRFTDMSGQIIDVYQAATQMTDESGQTYPKNIDALLDNALGPAGYYGAFTANMHTDQAQSTGSDAIVASAKARGVPVISALQLLQWLDARNGSSFGSISWSGNVLSFNVSAAGAARNLQAMLPISAGSVSLAAIASSGTPVSFSTQTIKGITYALFPVTTEAYRATYR